MTISSHLTIYRYRPDGLPEQGTHLFEHLAGRFRPQRFGPSNALQKD
jgi:hypothetical protein